MGAHNILLLGGTKLARDAASSLLSAGHNVTSSLAGWTQTPHLPRGQTRVGAFTDVETLISTLVAGQYDILIDATHPFSPLISNLSARASKRSQTPLLRLQAAPWRMQESRGWIPAISVEEAIKELPLGAQVFAALGRGAAEYVSKRRDVSFLLRTIDTPDIPLPHHVTLIKARPPFSLQQELALFRRQNIEMLVTKNVGGFPLPAKLRAARLLSLPVVMIARPECEPVKTFETVETLTAYLT